jgi:hypothetical protein
MNGVKGLLTSKTVWGVILMILGTFFKWTGEDVRFLTEAAVNIASLGLEFVGAVLAVYGRMRAEKSIKGIV